MQLSTLFWDIFMGELAHYNKRRRPQRIILIRHGQSEVRPSESSIQILYSYIFQGQLER